MWQDDDAKCCQVEAPESWLELLFDEQTLGQGQLAKDPANQ